MQDESFKLTAITFADENEDQDLDDWEDVGVNRSRPRGLLDMYRASTSGEETPVAHTAELEKEVASLRQVRCLG